MVAGLLPAILCAWLLARRDFVGKSVLSAILLTPMVLPPVVTGLLLLRGLGRQSALGRLLEAWGWPIPFSLTGAVLAALVVGFPLYVLSIRAALEAVDPRLEQVSWSLGVPPFRTFLRITLPLSLPGIAAGMVLAFARALGEFGATAVLSGNIEGKTRTISLAVYSLLELPSAEGPMRLLLGASLSLSLGALVAYEGLVRWQRRRLEVDPD